MKETPSLNHVFNTGVEAGGMPWHHLNLSNRSSKGLLQSYHPCVIAVLRCHAHAPDCAGVDNSTNGVKASGEGRYILLYCSPACRVVSLVKMELLDLYL